MNESKLVSEFLIKGRAEIRIDRADGVVEYKKVNNTVIALGLNQLAARAVSNTTSLFSWMALGTQTDTASLGSSDMLEVARNTIYTNTSSESTMILVADFSGYTNEITSLQLASAGVVNHPSSGAGVFLNMLTGLDSVLANSDTITIKMLLTLG